jgi:uncharacterized membrane protein
MKVFQLMPWADWLALLFFALGWAGYVWFAKHWSERRPSVLHVTNRMRLHWMKQATQRDPRMLDGLIAQSLSSSPSFFASTTIIIIGGILALLGTTDKAAEFVKELPFSEPTTMLVFDLKLLVLLAIFVYAFFRFTWSLRQYTFASLLIGAMPSPEEFASGQFDRELFANRAARVAGLAAETFNDGLRAYYFSFAAMTWLLNGWFLVLSTWVVIFVLYRREFHSVLLDAFSEQKSGAAP